MLLCDDHSESEVEKEASSRIARTFAINSAVAVVLIVTVLRFMVLGLAIDSVKECASVELIVGATVGPLVATAVAFSAVVGGGVFVQVSFEGPSAASSSTARSNGAAEGPTVVAKGVLTGEGVVSMLPFSVTWIVGGGA